MSFTGNRQPLILILTFILSYNRDCRSILDFKRQRYLPGIISGNSSLLNGPLISKLHTEEILKNQGSILYIKCKKNQNHINDDPNFNWLGFISCIKRIEISKFWENKLTLAISSLVNATKFNKLWNDVFLYMFEIKFFVFL